MQTFRDPVHNIIQFDPVSERVLLELIDSAALQRLRHIKQLGLSSYTYPGAEHSRFSHSLGVCHLMKRFIETILGLRGEKVRRYQEELKEHRMLALVAALLHDIGHGPFSHALEKTTGIDHEEWTQAIITGGTEITQILESYQSGFAREVADVIRRTHSAKSVVKLLSSQLDTDRVDYLLRDSLMTGAGYGRFDLEWLIHVLRIGTFRDDVEVGLDLDKGLSIAEDFVMARYYMYKHVYYHKSTRSAELIVGKILQRAVELRQGGVLPPDPVLDAVLFPSAPPITKERLDAFLQLTDHTLWHTFYLWQRHEDPVLSRLCHNLIERRLYKSIRPSGDEFAFFKKLQELAARDGVPVDYIYLKDTPSMSSYTDVYLSHQPKDESEGEREASEQIVLFDHNGVGHELSDQSLIIGQLRNKSVQLARIYVPEQYKAILTGGLNDV